MISKTKKVQQLIAVLEAELEKAKDKKDNEEVERLEARIAELYKIA